jgi:diguanylate cyclase (GGDEF)-like protein
LEQALQVTERVRKGIEDHRVATPAGNLSVTASFGVTMANQDGERSLVAIIERADQALYQSKAGGRNQINVA